MYPNWAKTKLFNQRNRLLHRLQLWNIRKIALGPDWDPTVLFIHSISAGLWKSERYRYQSTFAIICFIAAITSTAKGRCPAQQRFLNRSNTNILVDMCKKFDNVPAGQTSQSTSPSFAPAKKVGIRVSDRRCCQHKENSDSPKSSGASQEDKACKLKSMDFDRQV